MLTLTAKIKITGPYCGTSKFPFWSNLEDGDVLMIMEKLKDQGKYIPILKVNNLRSGEVFQDTRNSLCKYLEKVKFEIV